MGFLIIRKPTFLLPHFSLACNKFILVKTTKKIPKTFIVFFIISLFIWLLITFSKEYTAEVTIPIVFKNIPQNKLLQQSSQDELRLSVKASGFKLATAKIRNKAIDIDASKVKQTKKGKYYIISKKQFLKIQAQLRTGIYLQSIEKDTISLNIGELVSKYVPVLPKLNLEYHIGYNLLKPITIKPDSILISGPSSEINEIKNLALEPFILKNIKTDFTEALKLEKPSEFKNIKFKDTKVIVSGKVDKFTEGEIKVPFTIKNKPDGVNITMLNEEIQLVFTVALTNFNKISKASFKIECDYSMYEKNNLTYLVPKVISKPNFVRNVKLLPSKIDFLIQK